MEVVKYLCEVGGEELLMRADEVSGRMHVKLVLAGMCVCRHAAVLEVR